MNAVAHRWAKELAHALSCREAAKASRNRNAYQYWRNRVHYARGRLNAALVVTYPQEPAPEQRPLFVDDLADGMRQDKAR